MPARVTISVKSDGELEIWLNPEGRDQLVHALQALNVSKDHFHLGTWGGDIELSAVSYRPTDKIVDTAKVLFRPDEWDQRYFPHVVANESGNG
jgi:hypothetical protein